MTPTEPTPLPETPERDEAAPGSVRRKLVPVQFIERDLGMQVRGQPNPEKVLAFREIIREHGFMDALDVFHINPADAFLANPAGARFLLADGFSRLEAYEAEGIARIPCNIRTGDRSRALEFGLHKNGHHGEAMTNDQKRHACELAVLDPQVSLKTDKEIAKLIGCSPTLVGQARRGETQQQASAKTKARTRQATAKEAGERTVPVTAHERKAPNTPPTKAAILKQIEDWVDRDQVDEAEVVKIFESKDSAYFWLPKPGNPAVLRVVGKSGREQVSLEVFVKELSGEQITLKNEGAKLAVEA